MSTGTDQSSIIALMQFDFEQPGDQLNDLTGHGIVGTLSDCTLVDDPDMSLCQQFNGTSSSASCAPTIVANDSSNSFALQNGITITTWVWFDSLTDPNALLHISDGKNNLDLYTQGNNLVYNVNVNNSPDTPFKCEYSLDIHKWYHLAIAVDHKGNAQFFVDGIPHSQTTDSALAPPNMSGGNKAQYIGKNGNTGTPQYFSGTMAWMAVYNGACQQPMIEADLAQGESKRFTSFRQSFPVGFKLNSDDGGAESPILFIESQGEGKDLHLRVHNTGSTPINFYTPSPAITKASEITDENYHVQLRFRPGILAENYIAENPITSLLKLSSETATNWLGILKKDTSGTYSMNFLYIGSAPLVIPAQGEALIVIKEVNASASQGSRNTNVEFRYQNVLPGKTPVLTGASQTVPLEGHRVQNLSIVNHAGVKDIALRAEIVGPANVMTYSGAADETPPESSLQFQLVNTGSNDLELGLPSSADGATEFTLTIDVQLADYTAEWALIDHGVGNKLTLALGDGVNGWTLDANGSIPTGNPNQLQWNITNQSVNSFAQGKGLTFTLSGIECSLPAGSSIVTIGYKNIPGHWQGSFELPVTKSPVTYSRNGIGINTQEPKANLHIVEGEGSIPLRIGKPNVAKTLPAPGNDSNYMITDLVQFNDAATIFFDPTIRYNVGSHLHFNVVVLNNGTPEITSLPLSTCTAGTGSLVVHSEPYIYFFNGQYLNIYSLSEDGGTITYEKSSTPIAGGVDQNAPGALVQGFLYYNYSGQVVVTNVSGDSFGAFSSNNYINLPSAIHTDAIADIYGLGNYMLLIDDANLYVLEPDTSKTYGNLNVVGSMLYTGKGKIQSFGSIICLVNDDSVVIVDVYDPASPQILKTVTTSGQSATGNVIMYNDYLLRSGNDNQDIYVYDLGQEDLGTAPLKLTFDSSITFSSIGLCSSNNIYLSQDNKFPTAPGNSTQSQFINTQDLFDYITGSYTYMTADSIGLNVNHLPEDATLAMPYPNDDARSGIKIGEGFASTNAAISMLVAEESTVDPVSIMSYYGQPIFMIKQPSEGDIFRVGIGTDNPKAPLHVAGSTSMQVSDFGFLNNSNSAPDKSGSGCAGYFAGTLAKQVAIYTDQYIVALQFNAVSDLRVKDVLSLSDQGSDLSTLLSLQVSDYQYIDFVGKGAGQKKGLIAQQVKEVFPHAVSAENTDFIPDIYAMATDLQWQQATHHLQVKLENAHDLTVGDTVRVLAEEGFVEKDVVAVPDEKSFVISEWEKPVEKLFVFGKEVHDFHTVDYDQVAMLGVSAIQALHAEVEALKKENEALKSQMQSEMAELKEEWAAFKTSVAQQYQN